MGSKYVDSDATIQMIGCILKQPSLLDEEGRYFFSENDFVSDFHRITFGAIYNLYNLGAKNITVKAIEDYLSNRPESYAIYKSGQGPVWLTEAEKNADVSNFEYYYNRVKKMTLLREYSKVGLDTSWLYDPDILDDFDKKQRQNNYLDSLSLNEIADLIDNKILSIRASYIDNSSDESISAATGIDELFASLQEVPDVGQPMYGGLINTITRGMRLGKFYLRSAASGVGKALPNSTRIPTPNGWKTVEEIQPGDYLFDAFGKPTLVKAVYPQGLKEVWEVTFKDGRKAKCCEEHLWSYCTIGQKDFSKEQRKFYTKTLKEISQMQLKGKSGENKILVPMQQPVQYSTKKYTIPPYSFGTLLGDGSFRYDSTNKALFFSSQDEEIVATLADEMGYSYHKNSNFNCNWTFNFKESFDNKRKNVWVEEILKDYPNLWNTKSETKFIPRDYLEGDIQQRFDLLNGLLDTDGSIDKEKGRISYWTVSPILKDNVIELCESLGLKTTYGIDTHKDSLPVYYIHITGPIEQKSKLFKLKRKKELLIKWINNGKKKEKNTFNPIVKIENLHYKENMTCFYVDNNEHLFLMNDFIVTHNTRTMIADFCNCGCNKIWEENEWKDNGEALPCLFISTELELEELQTMMVAFLTNINEENILNNVLSFEERDRIKEAIQIIKESPLYIEIIPDFSLKDIENIIKRNIRLNKCRYIFYDYIHTSMKILEEITRRSGGIKLREDNILFLLSVKLKEICTQFNVFIMSSTQLNGDWKTSAIPDQNLLRGAKSISDKVDYGSILLDVTQEDKEMLQNLIDNDDRIFIMPNVKLSIYKNRRGSYTKCYLWMYADKSTCRFNGLFCTDYNYELIPITETYIHMRV